MELLENYQPIRGTLCLPSDCARLTDFEWYHTPPRTGSRKVGTLTRCRINDMSQNQQPAIARRWPDYQLQGEGNIAVVLHCCKRIVLVGFVLEARQMVADSCGAQCRTDENPKWHAGFYLTEVPRKEITRHSMKRLPGWDED